MIIYTDGLSLLYNIINLKNINASLYSPKSKH